MGKKMEGCPYSIFEDGRDVKEFIIPPKGYVFKGFRFDPDASNQIYDGKLTAEFEKEPFNDILRSYLWKVLLALGIIAIITVVVILALNVFNKPKPIRTPEPTVVVSDTTKNEAQPAQTTELDGQDTPSGDSVKPVQKDDDVILDLNAKKDTVKETPQPAADDPNVQFKQAFWTLIHERTIKMDPYDNLYKENRNKAEGEEYEYLRLTILKDYNSFKEWSSKLHKIPLTDLESINSIKDLKNKLYEIE